MKEVFDLITGMTPYLLLGFFLAGLMHAFVPNTLYRRYVGGSTFRSVFNAAMLGIPLPLCSCGVIPTAMSLRKEGASKGATVSFLIATPQTGVDSIIATYSLMGLPFALIRPFVALATSLFGGVLVNRLDDNKAVVSDSGHASDTSASAASTTTFGQKLLQALKYAFVEMMQDIGKWLVVGLVAAGLITVFVPESFFSLFADKPLLSMLLVLAFSIPMYLCATGSIPIAVALMLKGLSPGTALVLLMAGPAVNVASMLVISKVMGRKTLFLYLLSIITGAVVFGLCIDYLLPREWFTAPLMQMHSGHEEGLSLVKMVCSVAFFLLLGNAFYQRYFRSSACCCGCHGHADYACSDDACSCESVSHAHAAEPVNEFKVKGMTCNHCKNNVEKAILSVEGVTRVEINLVSGQTWVYGKADPSAVVQAVKEIGFEI